MHRIQHDNKQGSYGKGMSTSDYSRELNKGACGNGVSTSDYSTAMNMGHMGSEYIGLQQGIKRGSFGKGVSTSDYNSALNRGNLGREWVRQTTIRHSTGTIWQGSEYVRLQQGIKQGPFGKGVNTSDYNKALNRGHLARE